VVTKKSDKPKKAYNDDEWARDEYKDRKRYKKKKFTKVRRARLQAKQSYLND
jgi:hypothetical protein